MNIPMIKFNRRENADFIKVLKKRVNDYFQENNLSRHANVAMVTKTIFMLSLFFVPYALMIGGVTNSYWLILGLWALMGVGKAGIGLSIMHDANHGAYSRYGWVNVSLGYLMNLIGGNALNWRIQHNVLHHSFTNIDGMDEDIDAGTLLRFSPHQPRRRFHRLQYIYAWFLYGLMTFMWVTTKDFRQILRYHREGLLASQNRTLAGAMSEAIATKMLYFSYILALPLLFAPAPWWLLLIGFVIMHYITGLSLACIFQPAHVMPSSEYPLPDENGNVENHWAIHQLLTTTNFAPASRFFSWFVGGLNFQIEHHLFPNICHVHYKKISRIVRQTAQEFNLPYHVQPTFAHALWNHGRMLWVLGR
jgi:linoleoyl-CoA desaturase